MWLWLILSACLANAVVQMIDKFLLTKSFTRASSLTFLIASANLLGVFFVFGDFNWSLPSDQIALAVFSGVAFTVALQFLYLSFRKSDVSRMSPLVGGLVTLFSLLLAFLFVGEALTALQLGGVALLALGCLVLGYERVSKKEHRAAIVFAGLSALFFAVAYVLQKHIFLSESFSTGFVYARLGTFLSALPLLLIPGTAKELFGRKSGGQARRWSSLLVVAINMMLAAYYFVAINYSFSLTDVTVVNALSGLQYAMLLAIVWLLSTFAPKVFREKFSAGKITQEIIAVLLIVGGLALLA